MTLSALLAVSAAGGVWAQTGWGSIYKPRSEGASGGASGGAAGGSGGFEPSVPYGAKGYSRSEGQVSGIAENVCVAEILSAQRRHGIPDNLLLAIGLQEAGRKRDGVMTVWPWTVNSNGVGRYFNTREEAQGWVRQRISEGIRSNDVGCMQINLRWHPDAFARMEDGFVPSLNVDYAARHLTALYRKTGNWRAAAGAYHSFTPDKRATYLASLDRNIAVANRSQDYFVQLASVSPGEPAAATGVSGDPIHIVNRPRRDIPLWGAALSAGHEGGGRPYSLYSANELQPILPDYEG